MKYNKFLIFVLIFILNISLTGCWDIIEINDRAIVMAIGIDKKDDKISATYAIPNLPVVTGQSSGDQKRFVKTSEGLSLIDANNNFSNISSKKLSYDHAKVIVLGDELLSDKELMKGLIDYFARSPEFSLSLLIAATDKSGKELIDAEPNSSEVTGVYIAALYSDAVSREQGENRVDLIDLIVEVIETDGNGRLPLVVSEGEEIKNAGLVILKDYTKHYTLNKEQLNPYFWLIGKGKEDIKVIEFEDNKVSYEINSIKRRVNFKKRDLGFDVDISIRMEGDIRQYDLLKDMDMDNNKIILEIKDKLKEEFEKEINEFIRIVQEDIKIDILNLAKEFKVQERKFWEEYKDNWDTIISSSTINVEVTPYIRRIGMSN